MSILCIFDIIITGKEENHRKLKEDYLEQKSRTKVDMIFGPNYFMFDRATLQQIPLLSCLLILLLQDKSNCPTGKGRIDKQEKVSITTPTCSMSNSFLSYFQQ